MTDRQGLSRPGSIPAASTGTSYQKLDPISRLLQRSLNADAGEYLLSYRPPAGCDEVVYLSTPITTGPRLLEWLATNHGSLSESDGEVVQEEVIAQNLEHIRGLRERLRDSLPLAYLIDPTTLTATGWQQRDYHRFWAEVIKAYVDRIIFADGWDLSTGCNIEYAMGLSCHLPMEDERGRVLQPSVVAGQLRRAATTLAKAGRDPSIALAASDWARTAALHARD